MTQKNPQIKLTKSRLLDEAGSVNSQDFGSSKVISTKVLDKHLKWDQHNILNSIEYYYQEGIKLLRPFYAISKQRMMKNCTGLVTSTWDFNLSQEQIQSNIERQKSFIKMSHYKMNLPAQNNTNLQWLNKSVSQSDINSISSSRKNRMLSIKRVQKDNKQEYKLKYNRSMQILVLRRFLFIWGPITLVILTYLINKNPFLVSSIDKSENASFYIDIMAGGFIDIILMVLLSFILFVFFKALKYDQVHSVFQHICLSSYVGLFTIIYALVCSSLSNIIVIPMTLIYIFGASYLHINAYNQNIKPHLFQLIGLSLIVLFFYTSAAFMFFKYYHLSIATSLTQSISPQKHFILNRYYEN